MKTTLFFLGFVIITTQVDAQQNGTKYYNDKWTASSKQDSKYYVDFIKKDTLYYATSYFTASQKLEGVGIYADTGFTKRRGLNKSYNEQGILIDSSYYFSTGNSKFRYHYFDNGKLSVYYLGDEKGVQKDVKGYDESGNEIKDYIFEKEAEYPGGATAWIKFMSENIKPNVPVKKKAPKGTYTVIVRFIVDKNGQVSDIGSETNWGYGMEEEAMRVIRKSPKWISAVQNNKPVNAYRRQPLTFVVQ